MGWSFTFGVSGSNLLTPSNNMAATGAAGGAQARLFNRGRWQPIRIRGVQVAYAALDFRGLFHSLCEAE
jgi:hypothetical protein